MNLWFVIPQYEDGAWLTGDGDSDTAYLSERSALLAKEELDEADYAAHRERESKRLERHILHRTARAILEASGFEEVDQVLPKNYGSDLEERTFESRYCIITVEIKE